VFIKVASVALRGLSGQWVGGSAKDEDGRDNHSIAAAAAAAVENQQLTATTNYGSSDAMRAA